MLPQTFAALFAFLGLVTPGLVFQLIRESQRPALQESAFREASRVALTSLIFTAASALLIALLSLRWPKAFADVPAWLSDGGRYASTHLEVVAWTVGAEVLLATALAAVGALIVDKLRFGPGAISKSSIWHKHFAADLPTGCAPWLKVTLDDGTQLWGWLDYYTVDKGLADRELALKGPGLAMQSAATGVRVDMENTDFVQLRGSTIRLTQVMHRPKVSETADADGLDERAAKPRLDEASDSPVA